MRASRPFDVVVWGATGYTGRLVAEYLVRHHGVGKRLRWAIGGRSRDKLEGVRRGLEAIDPAARELPLLTGDNHDRASLAAMARQTRVVASTVGPYAIHGRELVAACVEAPTDYCDLTGETPFVRDMIDQHHARARETGSRIVHCCGFDSIPSDLGTLMVQEHARATRGAPCHDVKHFVKLKGAMSGGTAASMVQIVEEATRDRRVRRLLADPYALDPQRSGRGSHAPDGADQRGVRWDDDVHRWTGPFVMAAINTRVVRRTNALLGYAWGEDFRYHEAMAFGRGAKGWLGAAGLSVGLAVGMGVMAVAPVRKVIAKRLPASGEGPSPEQRESGFFVSELVGTIDGGGAAGAKVRGTVRGHSDPGYGETAKMLGESALCLALDEAVPETGGVLTPAACMGMRLVERLRAAGMTFEVE
jgi:short subunit dehydrogenase-like uncharacterized protein